MAEQEDPSSRAKTPRRPGIRLKPRDHLYIAGKRGVSRDRLRESLQEAATSESNVFYLTMTDYHAKGLPPFYRVRYHAARGVFAYTVYDDKPSPVQCPVRPHPTNDYARTHIMLGLGDCIAIRLRRGVSIDDAVADLNNKGIFLGSSAMRKTSVLIECRSSNLWTFYVGRRGMGCDDASASVLSQKHGLRKISGSKRLLQNYIKTISTRHS